MDDKSTEDYPGINVRPGMAGYRIDYVINIMDDEGNPIEIGFGGTGKHDKIEDAAFEVQSQLDNGLWAQAIRYDWMRSRTEESSRDPAAQVAKFDTWLADVIAKARREERHGIITWLNEIARDEDNPATRAAFEYAAELLTLAELQ